MPALYLVDTSAWIFALRREPHYAIPQRIGALLDVDAAATCRLVELELLGGWANEAEYARLQVHLRGLHRLPTEEADWEAAARLAFSPRRAGVTVPFTDALIAALAIRHGTILLRADRDFDLLAKHADLAVESLTDLVSPPGS